MATDTKEALIFMGGNFRDSQVNHENYPPYVIYRLIAIMS